MSKKHVVVSLSGGMDSSTLLLRCLKEYDTVTAISFDYGQKHSVELQKAQSLVNYLNGNVEKTEQDQLGTITVVGKNYNEVMYRQIQLNGLVDCRILNKRLASILFGLNLLLIKFMLF